MADVREIIVDLDGLTGLPGVSVFHSLNSTSGAVAAIRAFYNTISGFFPSGMTIQVRNTGDVLDSDSGHLVSGWTDTAVSVVNGGGTGGYAAGTGTFIRWQTGAIVGGRRLRGRTFIVPITSAFYQSNGTITDANVGALQTAADTLWGTGTLNVWHRPPVGTFAGGALHVVTGATAVDKVTSLRSRRV